MFVLYFFSFIENPVCTALICSGQLQPRSEITLSASSVWSHNAYMLLDVNESCLENQYNALTHAEGTVCLAILNRAIHKNTDALLDENESCLDNQLNTSINAHGTATMSMSQL